MEKFYERTFVCHECQLPLFIETVSFNQKGEIRFYLYCQVCKRYFHLTMKIEEMMASCYLMDRNLEVFDGGVCNGKKTQ
jgi:transcription elongation factor Elf1